MDNTTAKVSCFARAYHFENNKTHIFADSMAARLLGDDYDHIAESGAGEQMKALYSFAEMKELLSGCGFAVAEHLGAEDMTERYFSDYNSNTPEHPMSAPVGVDYVLAVRK